MDSYRGNPHAPSFKTASHSAGALELWDGVSQMLCTDCGCADFGALAEQLIVIEYDDWKDRARRHIQSKGANKNESTDI